LSAEDNDPGSPPEETPKNPEPPLPAETRAAVSPVGRFAFLVIPAIAVLELGAHLVQVSRRISPDDWAAARQAVQSAAHPEDLVVFSPRWLDPLGREYFKDDLATVEREARPDDTRFPRAFEVSIRGEHLAELDGWKKEGSSKFGAITVTTYDNPSPATVIDDLVVHATPEKTRVEIVESGRESECPWTRGSPQTGNLGFGPGLPADRFVCPHGPFVATSVLQATDYLAHKCIYAPAVGGSSVLRIRFLDVQFGRVLHGHHAINWDSARFDSPPVTLVWKAEGRTLARLVDQDADGWKGFEIDTSDLAGQKGELIAEVSSTTGNHRQYCFEADTR
jgi:hypothetical protein